MNIGILHLTDIHISDQTNLTNNCDLICKAIGNDFLNVKKVYIVISGDIAYAGKKEEYSNAKLFIKQIQETLSDIDTKIILVPGNHDCNFNYDDQVRKNNVSNPSYKILGDDNSVIDYCLSVQKDFWDFYSEFNPIPDNKISFRITDEIDGKTICFHCHNTAWMSKIKEQPGSLFFPVKLVKKFFQKNDFDINISVYHHPTNWFSPNTIENNKKEFQEFLDEISSMQLIGHEHESLLIKRDDLDNMTTSLDFSGAIFHDKDDPDESGFQIINLDVSTNQGHFKRFSLSSDLYIVEKERYLKIEGNKQNLFNISDDYINQISEINIPLLVNNGTIKLQDIFVFPSLEIINVEQKFVDYFDSINLIGNDIFKNCIIKGDCQSGKSSLLRMLFIEYKNRGYYPILLNGDEINSLSIDNIIQNAFNKIYSNDKIDYERFKQIEKEKKIILIDDFNKIKIKYKAFHKLIDEMKILFNQTIITIDIAYGLSPEIQSKFNEFHTFLIKPLGYKKINDLIEKYHFLCDLSEEKQEILQNVRSTFDQVRLLLRNKVLPSYPIFLLSILQSLHSMTPLNLDQTSYGYCYQALIYYALTNKAKVSNDDLGAYINFIKELSYYFYQNKIECIKETDLSNFHQKYSENFMIPAFETIKTNLLNSYILKKIDSYYEFSYKYILYYLIAKHISEILNTGEGKEIINQLFNRIHLEKNANILVFITHHTKDISFIESALFNAMLPFEKTIPITLDNNCAYYKQLEKIVQNITNDIIDPNKIPEIERNNMLIAKDESERQIEKQTKDNNDNEEINEAMFPFVQAFRSIDIVGQIVKNRRGSLPKKELVDHISELYLTGFRTISFLGNIFTQSKDDLTSDLKENFEQEAKEKAKGRDYLLKQGIDKETIYNKVSRFFQIISMQTCLGIFAKLVFSVGIKDFNNIFDDVALKIGTPAAKLVSFSINSYYNEISVKELQNLAKEFKSNPVALHVLKARARSYLYNNHVERTKKQQIAQALNMKIEPNLFLHKD